VVEIRERMGEKMMRLLSQSRRCLMALEMLTPTSCPPRELDQVGAPELLHWQMYTSSAAGCPQQARCTLMSQLLFTGLMVHLFPTAQHSLVTRTCTNPSEMAFQQAVNSCIFP